MQKSPEHGRDGHLKGARESRLKAPPSVALIEEAAEEEEEEADFPGLAQPLPTPRLTPPPSPHRLPGVPAHHRRNSLTDHS